MNFYNFFSSSTEDLDNPIPNLRNVEKLPPNN